MMRVGDDTRLHRAADSEPGRNRNFDRRWHDVVTTGPNVPTAPAHGTAWRVGEAGDPNTTSGHRARAWRAAAGAGRTVRT